MAYLESRDSRLFDYINNFRFHVLDVSFQTPVVFNLSYGFHGCTAPEITFDIKDVKSGTFPFPRPVVSGANPIEIELRQGVRLFNSDFYDWASKAVYGRKPYRRNLLLLQFTDAILIGDNKASGVMGFLQGVGQQLLGLNDLLARVPARAWFLKGCVPTRYKSGTDLDAMGNDVSIAEMGVKAENLTEFNLGIG